MAADFERTALESRAAYQALFDFEAVGVFEKLLRRYDALGRIPLSEEARAALLRDSPEPYPPERERRNLGHFYAPLAQRTVGTGGCRGGEPVAEYARHLAGPFPAAAGRERGLGSPCASA